MLMQRVHLHIEPSPSLLCLSFLMNKKRKKSLRYLQEHRVLEPRDRRQGVFSPIDVNSAATGNRKQTHTGFFSLSTDHTIRDPKGLLLIWTDQTQWIF